MMSTPLLDLSQLAIDRAPPQAVKPRPRRVLTRYVIPLGILLGFSGLLGAAAGARLWPQPSVQVLPVIVKRSEVQQAGTPLFQAAGWIEPRPTAISVAALAPGVIEELLVVEGQQVSKGEPIARLITIDAELAVRRAEATLAIREGELARVDAERRAAKVLLEEPVHWRAQWADAQSMLAKAKTELDALPFLIDSARARLEYARESLSGKQAAQSAVATRLVQQAESEEAAAAATLGELQQRQPNLQREVDALQAKLDAVTRQLELLVDENRQLQEAEAKLQSAVALRDEAKLQLEQARLMLERNTIRAPIDGRVLRLVATPGSSVMGTDLTARHSSNTVIEMYDPVRLQVRADVRLEDVPLIQKGQPVEIQTASSSRVIQGRVLQATSSASVQKNTLEVKISLLNPPLTVSPEMLVTATFLAPASADAGVDEPAVAERIFVPNQLVQTGETGTFVWTVDAEDRAQRRSVTLGKASDGELVEIREGLDLTSKLVASGGERLTPGSPVHVLGEEPSIGID